MAVSLAQHHGICEGRGARGNMHGRPASEVQAAHLRDPAVGVPCPAGDGVVDEGCPDEDEDDAGEHAASFGCCADGQGGSDGCEHALEDTEC